MIIWYWPFFVETADNLKSDTIIAEGQQNKTGTVLIKWKDPLSPNGPIIKYVVEYSKGGLGEVSVKGDNLGSFTTHLCVSNFGTLD